MKRTYLLTSENEIVAYPSRKEAEAAAEQASDDIHGFDSADSLESVLASGPATRAVEVWNGLPGVEPVKGFKSKGVAAKRIFQRLQSLGDGANAEDETTQDEVPEPVAKPKKAKRERKPKADKKPRKSAKKAKKAKPPKKERRAKAVKGESKKAQVVNLLRHSGATLEEIVKLSGWSAGSAKMFIGWIQLFTGFGIKSISSDKNSAGERVYVVV